MMPAYYEYAANGTIPERRGVAGSPLQVPQGLFPCSGEDRWIAIDASDPTDWRALRALIGDELHDPKFDTLVGRLRNRAELEAAIANWTREQEADADRASTAGSGCAGACREPKRRPCPRRRSSRSADILTKSMIRFSAKRKSRDRGSRSIAHRFRRLGAGRESVSIRRKCWRPSWECRKAGDRAIERGGRTRLEQKFRRIELEQ